MSDAGSKGSRKDARRRQAHAARRRREELRFRLYGVGAVLLAIAALVVLLGSILNAAASAFTSHHVTLNVYVDPAIVDPRGEEVPTVLRRADYNRLMRAALREEFPDVSGRTALRDLYSLVSAVNAGALRERVLADPSVIGQSIAITVPISDDVDLYFSGRGGETEVTSGLGARIEMDGEIAVIRAQRGSFAPIAQALRGQLALEAANAAARAQRVEKAAGALDDEAAAFNQRRRADNLRARAADYEARSQADGALALSEDTPSVLVFIEGRVIRAQTLTEEEVRGEVISASLAREADGETQEASAASAEVGDEAPRGEGAWRVLRINPPEADRRVSDRQIAWAETLVDRGALKKDWNRALLVNSDSREPELAGLRGSLIGSLMTMFITMLMAVPIGVLSAIYLEEFAPKNTLTSIIEVNINNLAAVPSIIFGLLGLAVFINVFDFPRGAPLVGGMVLALMTLPIVIIATRAALKSVPPSIRAGALAVGASPTQAVFHHVLPQAAAGIMTGSIIGLARALGETAPLLMIGMVAFVAEAPKNIESPATVLPVQIYLWASAPERAFETRTAAAILVLLVLMIVLNLVAIVLRQRFQRRW